MNTNTVYISSVYATFYNYIPWNTHIVLRWFACRGIAMAMISRILQCSSLSNSHYGDVIMGTMASQITSLTIVFSTVLSGAN